MHIDHRAYPQSSRTFGRTLLPRRRCKHVQYNGMTDNLGRNRVLANSCKVGGVVTDLYNPRSRGFPMSIFATASFSGGLGQLVSGFIVPVRGWRWIYWHQLIINGCLMLVIVLFFKETRGPVLLSRKARALNLLLQRERSTKSSPNPSLRCEEKGRTIEVRWKVEEDEKRQSIQHMIKSSLTLPFCEPTSLNTLI
jgi:MFS family permease